MSLRDRFGELGLIILNSHPKLGREIASELEVEPIGIESSAFPNGEYSRVRIIDRERVCGGDIYILGSLHSGYDTIGEMRRVVQAVRNERPARVIGVFFFVRDGKSERAKRPGEAVAYKDTAMLISSSGLDEVVIFDQHTPQHPGFYDTSSYQLRSVHHLHLMRVLVENLMVHRKMYDGVLALDHGCYNVNNEIAGLLGLPISLILKKRDPDTRKIDPKKTQLIGKVRGYRVVGLDDMLQSGETMKTGAEFARRRGARGVSFSFVHPDFDERTAPTINPLLESGMVNEVYVLETIPLANIDRFHKHLIVLSPAHFIGRVITCINRDESLDDFFFET